MPMSPAVLSVLAIAVRHGLVMVAVCAVLLTALRVHGHGDSGHADDQPHMHACAIDHGDPDDHTDPDDCGHCHCPSSAVTVPESLPCLSRVPANPAPGYWTLVLVPDSVSYQPDPPPNRLG